MTHPTTLPRTAPAHAVLARAARTVLAGALVLALPACNAAQRLSEVGGAPSLSHIQDPQAQPGYQPVSLPMPSPMPPERNPNSLWRGGARAFFKDQRAAKVGDLLTVLIQIDDKASLKNETTRTRDNKEKLGMPNLLGLEATGLPAILPETLDVTNLINASGKTDNKGTGAIDRREAIQLKVAALITQSLPNGNMVVQGRQEIRVNFEVRELQITGVIRPEDISAQNTITYDKIAEARISYGGRGHLSDVQQPRYGQQIFDIISPF